MSDFNKELEEAWIYKEFKDITKYDSTKDKCFFCKNGSRKMFAGSYTTYCWVQDNNIEKPDLCSKFEDRTEKTDMKIFSDCLNKIGQKHECLNNGRIEFYSSDGSDLIGVQFNELTQDFEGFN